MRHLIRRAARGVARGLAWGTCSAVCWSLTAGVAQAQELLPAITRIEEVWELRIANAEPAINSPQVTCVISPFGSIDHGYAALDINVRSEPDYSPGGLQLHVWNPDNPIVVSNATQQGVAGQANETIQWTQTMSLADHVLTFSVVDGSSTTWGAFGGDGHLAIDVSTSLENLNAYDPSVSIANSGAGYGANRVESLTLKRVRWFTSAGLLIELDNPGQTVD